MKFFDSRSAHGIVLASVLSAFAACDGCSDDTDTKTACDLLGDECGKSCTGDSECKTGLFCGPDSTCTAECTPNGNQCGDGLTCDVRGHCVDADGQGGSTGAFMTDGGAGVGNNGQGGDGCGTVNVDFAPQIPTVLLLVDQSGSMTENFGGNSRWNVLYNVLMHPTNGVVSQLEDKVRFGLALYTGNNNTCPALTEVSIALGNRDAINAVYTQANPASETPTGDAITAVLPDIVAVNEPGPKLIVLATDGEPDTCEVPNPQTGQGEAIQAAQNAFAAGVRVSIIAVGGDVSLSHQQNMANAGAGLPLNGSQGNAPYYPANNQQALVDAFNEIINGVRSCVLDISSSIDPDKASQGHVFIDGVEIGYNDPNGWQLNNATQIEILGTSCDQIQNGDHTVTGYFPCDAVIPQ